jgi:hypothetical protein
MTEACTDPTTWAEAFKVVGSLLCIAVMAAFYFRAIS